MYLPKDFKKDERTLKKCEAKTGWFKSKKPEFTGWKMNLPKEWKTRKLRQREIKGIEATGVIIVPNTAGSELLNKLILKEAQIARVTGYMVKMAEGNGVPLNRLFPAP